MATQAVTIEGVSVCTGVLQDVPSQMLRRMAEKLRDRLKEAVVALACLDDNKAFMVVASTRQDLPAHQLIKEISSMIGGSGGGRWDFAQGGTSHPEKINQALQRFPEIVKKMIKS